MSKQLSRAAVVMGLIGALLPLKAVPAYAWLCYDSCVPDPQPPPTPHPECGEECIPGIHPKVLITGLVSDVRGAPIVGAKVYWTYGSVSTNSAGAYSITVWADQPVSLTATHHLYAWRTINIDNPVLGSTTLQNFVLPFLLNVEVSPQAFNNSPQKTLTFSVYSTVPTAGSLVWVDLPTGSRQQLSYDVTYVNPNGWSGTAPGVVDS